ncbi:MAG: molybdenum cofactor biosynthesis protein MoaE [Planctomycetota bacterium]|jgi:molybdopterin synthase catalytic subunit
MPSKLPAFKPAPLDAPGGLRPPRPPAGVTDLRVIDSPCTPFDLDTSSLFTESHGALASFIGVVRNDHLGKMVTHIDYSCQAALALNVLADLAAELRQRFDPNLTIRIVHGSGHMVPRDVAIVIHIGAGHRRAALEACDYAIEAIKRDLPVWKDEHYADGSHAWLKGS